MTLEELNALSTGEAREAFARCCGTTAWVERMDARRPFASGGDVIEAAEALWTGLAPAGWREAFTHHPRIGTVESLHRRFASTADLAVREQAKVAVATQAVLEALADGNRAYEERFGYIFIVCASGLTADQMLERLSGRLGNDPGTELGIAAKEQWKIMHLRLDRMLGGRG